MPENPENKDQTPQGRGLNRRQFLKGIGVAGAGSAALADLLKPEPSEAEPAVLQEAPEGKSLPKGMQAVTLNVNGQAMTMQVEPRTTLLNALRNHAEPPITGPKLVCNQGACGGCTVMVGSHTAYGCMLLAVDVVGKKITTVEGLSKGGRLSAVQEAFVARDAMMCGFCTPGFVMSVEALLAKNPNPTLDDVKHACAGNVCRCGTYPHIFEAALDAAKKPGGGANR